MNKNEFAVIILGALGFIGLGYGICARSKLAKVSERLDKRIDDLSSNMEFDIPEEIIHKAVDKAVRIESKKAVEKATSEAVTEINRDIHDNVKKKVENEYLNIKNSVLKEITVSASKIDVARVRRDVEELAKDAALEKFNDNLDDILDRFNSNLDNTSKIYASIREAITKGADSGQDFVVRLN